MKNITYIVIVIIVLATVVIGFKTMSKPITPGALGFIVWAISPYFYLSVLAKAVTKKVSNIAVFILALFGGGLGLWVIVDAMFIHLDAQGGLVYIFIPLWQWVLFIIATLPVYFLNRVKNA